MMENAVKHVAVVCFIRFINLQLSHPKLRECYICMQEVTLLFEIGG